MIKAVSIDIVQALVTKDENGGAEMPGRGIGGLSAAARLSLGSSVSDGGSRAATHPVGILTSAGS